MVDLKSENNLEEALDQLESNIQNRASSPNTKKQVRNQIKELYRLTERSEAQKESDKTGSNKATGEADPESLSPPQIVDIVSSKEDRAKDRLREKNLRLNQLKEILDAEKKGKNRESLKRFINERIEAKRNTVGNTKHNSKCKIKSYSKDAGSEQSLSRRKMVEELSERFDERKLQRISDEDLKKIYCETKDA
ncbi:hypothetical protein GLU64_00290 [Nanohaloarchaea archaeon]|nr:hypothetical protein [Candidatus Nanohaloarchaea archaeon]